MVAALKPLSVARRLAAVALLALYNGPNASDTFRAKRLAATLNPPAIEGFAAIRDEAGDDAHAHLLRLIAAYRGW